MIPASERAKMVDALDRAATVTGKHRDKTNKQTNKLRGFSLQANYTDRATVAYRRS
jgi:hypothetical protein